MFEKKAEEMAKNFAMHEMKYCTYEDYSIPKSPIKIAEESYLAGYNKAKEEIEAELLKCYQGYPEQMEIIKGVSN